MSQIHINALPIEILHLTFDKLEIDRSSLLSTSLVCYTWKLLSHPRLFRAIHIDQDFYSVFYTKYDDPPRPFVSLNMLMEFTNVLKVSESHWIEETKERKRRRDPSGKQGPRKQTPLSNYIRRLTFDKPEYSYEIFKFDTARALAIPTLEIISMTRNLTHLQIDDFYPLDSNKLKNALTHNHRLVELVLKSKSGPNSRRKTSSRRKMVFDSSASVVVKSLLTNAWELASFATQSPYMETLSYDDVSKNEYAVKQGELPRPPSDVRLDQIHVINSFRGPTIRLRTLNLTAAAPLVVSGITALAALSLPHLASFKTTLYLPGAVDADLHALIALITSFPPTLAELHLFDLPVRKDSGEGGDSSAWEALRDAYSDAAQAAFSGALYGALPHLTSVALSARFLSPIQLTAIPSTDKNDCNSPKNSNAERDKGLKEVFYYDLTRNHLDALGTALRNERNLPHLRSLDVSTKSTLRDAFNFNDTLSKVCRYRNIWLWDKNWGGKFYEAYRNYLDKENLSRGFGF